MELSMLRVIPRGLASLLTLFIITKLIGRKQVSELSLFDYVIGISIGNFAAEITINQEVSIVNGIVAVLVFGIVAILVSYLSMKSIILRRVLIGSPVVLMAEGKIYKKNLQKTHFDINDFLEVCRTSGYFDLNEINYAILEANGKVSFLPYAKDKPTTPKNQNLNPKETEILANIIIDGKTMPKNLESMNKTENWLSKQLKIKGYNDYDNILLATLDSSEKITIYEKNQSKHPKNILE